MFRRFERGSEKLWALPIVPRPVVATDRVVVGDRAAGCDELVGPVPCGGTLEVGTGCEAGTELDSSAVSGDVS